MFVFMETNLAMILAQTKKTHTYIHTYIHKHACTHARMHAHTHTHTHTHTTTTTTVLRPYVWDDTIQKQLTLTATKWLSNYLQKTKFKLAVNCKKC